VIADVRPGIYDGHCKPLKAGSLDKLFGIRRTGRGPARGGGLKFKDVDAEAVVYPLLRDPCIELAGGTPRLSSEGLPLAIGNTTGKGEAILLNFAMAGYPKLHLPETPEAAAYLLAHIFESAGVKPSVVTRTRKARTRNLETVRWRNGELEIVALFRHRGEDGDVEVELAEPRFVYDLRHMKALGQQKTFRTKVLGSRPTFLVLAPRPLVRVKASLSKSVVAAGERPRLRLKAPGAAGLHAVRIEATAPNGKPAEWLKQVLIVAAEPKEVTLPIAFNDPAGHWRIRAVDLFTGAAAAASLQVVAPDEKRRAIR
jgi:hypothetical protein